MKLREEFIQKCLADFHYELTREQMEQDWFLDKKNPYYKEKDCYIFRTADNCWMEIATKDLDSAFTEPFIVCDGRATEKKKHKGGYELLKEKYAKLEKERDEWKKDAEAKQTTIDQQSRKISQLTADLKVAQGNLEATDREHERQLKEMYDHMGWFKRMTWDWHHAPTFKEDERWNETH